MELYNQKLILCKAKLAKKVGNEEPTTCVLDLNFPIMHQEVCCEGVNYGCYPLPAKLDGKEVIAVVHYSITERKVNGNIVVPDSTAEVAKLGDKIVADYKTDIRVNKHWNVKKEDAYAKTTVDEHGVETVEKYSGVDKDEKVPFCISKVTASEKEISDASVKLSITKR